MSVRAIVLKGMLAALAFAVPAAQAAPPQTDAQIFAGYVADPAYKAYLLAAFNGTEPPPLKAKCASLTIVSLDPPMVVTPPTFAEIGTVFHISTGSWVARATLGRCGGKVVRRLLITGNPQTGTLHAQALIPGEFPGNLKLENDATHIVLPAAMGTAKCTDWKSLWVLDTKLTSPAKPQGWSETWTMQACGRSVTADVGYVADATGMNITARNVKVH